MPSGRLCRASTCPTGRSSADRLPCSCKTYGKVTYENRRLEWHGLMSNIHDDDKRNERACRVCDRGQGTKLHTRCDKAGCVSVCLEPHNPEARATARAEAARSNDQERCTDRCGGRSPGRSVSGARANPSCPRQSPKHSAPTRRSPSNRHVAIGCGDGIVAAAQSLR